MPDQYKDMTSAVRSYRDYYVAEKHLDRNGKWMGDYTRRPAPQWWPHKSEDYRK